MSNSSPSDEDRLNMCQFINNTRKELNLEAYPADFLMRQNPDDIRRLYGRHAALRDNFESGNGDNPIKENVRLLALPGALLLVMVVIIVSVNISLNPQQNMAEDYGTSFLDETAAEGQNMIQENKIFNYEISTNGTDEMNQSENSTTETEPFEISSFFSYEGSHSFIVQNTGAENLTFSSISVDDIQVSFGSFSGNYPIPSGESAYLNVSKPCDGSEHILKTIISSGEEDEFIMPSC